MPAGLDSDGKSLGGQQGPAFLGAAGRRYMRRWVADEHGEQFGKGEAGMLLDKWVDEMLAFSAGLAGRGRGISWLPGREIAAVAVAVALSTGVEEWLLVPVAFVLYLGRGIIWQLVEFFGRAGTLGG